MTIKRNILNSPFPAVAAAGAGAGAGAGASGALGTASAISAGVSGLDFVQNLGFGIANLILQNRAWTNQQAWQKYVYEDQKMLNDPSYIMQRRRIAGLNPYGDLSSMATGQPTPITPTGVGDAIANLSGGLSRSAEKAFQALSTNLSFRQLKLQEKKLDLETKMTDEQLKNLSASTAYQQLVNEITEGSKDAQIKLSKMQVEKMLSEVLLNNVQFQWLPEKFKAEIKKINAEANQTNYNWTRYMPQMLLLNKALNESQIDLNTATKSVQEKMVDKLAAEVTDVNSRGFAMKAIQDEVKNMKPGIAKSFMIAFLGVLEQMSVSMPLTAPK